MKQFLTVFPGIILLWAAFSRRSDIFYRIRGVALNGFCKTVMRVVYAVAGAVLIAAVILQKINGI